MFPLYDILMSPTTLWYERIHDAFNLFKYSTTQSGFTSHNRVFLMKYPSLIWPLMSSIYMSPIFSGNSEANASELLENFEIDIFGIARVVLQIHKY